MKPIIRIKRAYDKPFSKDGYRVLVDRLWPRGVVKETASLDEWAKELAPSVLYPAFIAGHLVTGIRVALSLLRLAAS